MYPNARLNHEVQVDAVTGNLSGRRRTLGGSEPFRGGMVMRTVVLSVP